MELNAEYYQTKSIVELRDIFAHINDYEYTDRAIIVLSEISNRIGKSLVRLTINDVLGYTPEVNEVELPISLISFAIGEGIFSDSQIKENETIWRYKRLMKVVADESVV